MKPFLFQKTTSVVLMIAYGNLAFPLVPVYAELTSNQAAPTAIQLSVPTRTPENIRVNRTAPLNVSSTRTPGFSDQPTELQLFQARVFPEPFVPVGGSPSASENLALAAAITQHVNSGGVDLVPFESFLKDHPASPWVVSVHLGLGLRYFSTGWFSKAIAHYDAAWQGARSATGVKERAVADRALGELLQMDARLGRKETLEQILQEVAGRTFTGRSTELVAGARDGLNLMITHPELAYRCGPGALDRIVAHRDHTNGSNPVLARLLSTDHGTSLASVAEWAREVGLETQLAFRNPGASILTPAVVHWRLGHYAALFETAPGSYRIEDPTFGARLTATTASIEAEASGYFLVPAGPLPAGWRSVSVEEAATIWGKGATNLMDTNATGTHDQKVDCPCCTSGMAVANAHAMLVSLNIADTPVGYQPPYGPAVSFELTYNQREASQPTTQDYSNLGNQWVHNWLSFVDEDLIETPNPGNTIVADLLLPTVRLPGGGSDSYGWVSDLLGAVDIGSYPAVFPRSHRGSAELKKIDVQTYVRTEADGSQMEFGRKTGLSFPFRYFLTRVVDPAGNAVTLGYDAQNRLTSLTDAPGQVTLFSYELAADPLKITKVTDPFGRYATIQYDASGRLLSITDVLGLTSAFTYAGTSDFVDTMTTPYGTSSFAYGESGPLGRNRWLEKTNPLGEKERVEARNDWSGLPDAGPSPAGMNVTTAYQNYRSTLFWDRNAYSKTYNAANPEQPAVVNGAHIYHWLHTGDTYNTTSSILENEKNALEGSRVWYNYEGQVTSIFEGISSAPTKVGRVLDDGTTQLFTYGYNSFDKVTQMIDPLGRETDFIYDPNLIDLLEVHQWFGPGASDYVVLGRSTYNAAHQPLTTTDAAGQQTVFSYNPAGQISTITNAKGEVTSFYYDPAGNPANPRNAASTGYLVAIDGPLAGTADTVTIAYDGYGRPRTVTDTEGYVVTTDYDPLSRPTLLTYPDATTEQIVYDRLDTRYTKDRRGRITQMGYNAIRQVVTSTDPLGRLTQFGWCKCGGLRMLVDPAGNTTTWTHDVQGRITGKNYPDNSSELYHYENNSSRLSSVTDAKGQVTNYAYYNDDQRRQVSFANATVATPSLSYVYDPVFPRVTSMTDGIGTTTYAYNPITSTPTLGAGKLASITVPAGNAVVSYSYDELGRVTTRSIDGAANTSTVQYDALGRINQTTNALGTFGYFYVNATGRVDHATYPNGQRTNYSYFPNVAATAGNGDQRLQQIQNLKPNGTTLSAFGYTYDVTGQIQTWSRQTDASSALTSVFKYDQADQLTDGAVPASATSVKNYLYRYDKAGNRTSEQIDSGVSAATVNQANQVTALSPSGPIRFAGTLNEPGTVTVNGLPASVDGANNFSADVPLAPGTQTVAVVAKDPSNNIATKQYQVTVNNGVPRTLAYDAVGNETDNGAGQIYAYNALNQLVKITQGTNVTEFVYDGSGQRVQEKLNGTVIKQWVWAGGAQPVEERDAASNVTKRFFGGLGEQVAGANYFYVSDHLGSVREMTDATGAVRARYDYDPYGRSTKVSGDLESDFGFTGFYRHQASGLNLTMYRAYDADLGRWLSRDPIEEEGGINLYQYVTNDPIGNIDPLGLFTLALGINVSGTAAGFFGISGGGTAGVIIDGHGNFGTFTTGSVGAGTGVGADGGVYIGVSNAPNISEYKGVSVDISVAGGRGYGGSVDVSISPDGGGPDGESTFVEIGTTLGGAVGASTQATLSRTRVDGVQRGRHHKPAPPKPCP